MPVIFSTQAAQANLGARAGARPWERSGTVDVEALVAWAYGVQFVDRFERAGLHAIEAQAAGFEVRGYSADGVGQLMAINNLGCRVDGGGAIVGDAVHPVAYAVAASLAGIEGADLVRMHGQAGTQPRSWVPPEHRVRPAMWAKPGREAAVEYQGPGRKGGYCQVLYVWDGVRESWGRGVYRRWWLALEELAWRLQSRPLGFVVSGPVAPAEPWVDAADPTPRLGPPSPPQT